jgi:hypothetical protein
MLSGAAMRLYWESKRGAAASFDEKMQSYCCGDHVLGLVMAELGVKVTQTWPMTQGEKPYTMPYGPNYWCQPPITMHHLIPDEVSQVWRFLRDRSDSTNETLLYKDLYYHFMAPNLTHRIDDWYNLSDDRKFTPPASEEELSSEEWQRQTSLEKDAFMNFESCGKACMANNDCYQWAHYDQTCHWSMGNWKLGRHRVDDDERKKQLREASERRQKREEGTNEIESAEGNANNSPDQEQQPENQAKVWRSGWHVEKILKWQDEHPCNHVQWVEVFTLP